MNKGIIVCCAFLHDTHVHTSPSKTELTKDLVTGEWRRERAGERAKQSKKVNGSWGSRTHTKITATYCLQTSESSQGWRMREEEGDGTGQDSQTCFYDPASRNGEKQRQDDSDDALPTRMIIREGVVASIRCRKERFAGKDRQPLDEPSAGEIGFLTRDGQNRENAQTKLTISPELT